jgi:uncharacterized protein with PIN domain
MEEKIVEFRFYEELNDFLSVEKRKKAFFQNIIGNPSIKDVIEAMGVPHVEIDLILVNGKSVDFNYRLQNEDKVAVYPVFETLDITPLIRLRAKPLRKPKFILDVHLGKLARYLRLLGVDTLYTNHYSDEEIIHIAKEKERIILTRDVDLLKNKDVSHGYWIRNTDPKKQIKEIIDYLGLRSHMFPFTLCVECNGALEFIEKSKVEKRLPTGTKQYYQDFLQCSDCGKIYWRGSHFEKLKKLVDELMQ